MQSRFTSDELFHFVGHKSPSDDEANYSVLGTVLRRGCVSHEPHDGSWGTVSHQVNWDLRLESEELIVPTVTCYADIPVNDLSIHVSKYGRFGIALPRHLLIRHGARPVIYIPTRSDDWESIGGTALLRDIDAVAKGFNKHVVDQFQTKSSKSRTLGREPASIETAIAAMKSVFLKDFLAFVKPFNSELPDNHPNNFYMEREWRKYGNMKFEPFHVSRLIVAKGYAERVGRGFSIYRKRIVEI